jgi:hypothetical protein
MVHMKFGALPLLCLLLPLIVSGCKSASSLTAKAIDCKTSKVEIIDSKYKREGTTTSWCARCEDQTYVCVTNINRDRISCTKVPEGPPCR